MMSLESNVVTSKEAEFLYPFDMNKKGDVLTVFDAFVKEDFLSLEMKWLSIFLNMNLAWLQKSQEIKLPF